MLSSVEDPALIIDFKPIDTVTNNSLAYIHQIRYIG